MAPGPYAPQLYLTTSQIRAFAYIQGECKFGFDAGFISRYSR